MVKDGSSSSSEEDGDPAWRAAIESVAAVDFGASAANGRSKLHGSAADDRDAALDDKQQQRAPKAASHGFKLYQIKAQKLLNDFLEKSLVILRDPTPIPSEKPQTAEGGIRLFRKSPLGIILDPIDPHSQPRKRPHIIPGDKVDEKSKKFSHQVQSVTVDGDYVMVSARNALQRALARFEDRDVAIKAVAKTEEERVANLKKLRGEKWLPSIAREMQLQAEVGGKMATLERKG